MSEVGNLDYSYNDEPETKKYSDTTGSLNNLKIELTEQQAKQLKQKSIEKVKDFEVSDFMRIQREFFGKDLSSDIDFVNEVKRIQSESFAEESKQTGIIDEETLKAIYLNVYQYNDELIQNPKFYFVRDKILRYLNVDNSSEGMVEAQESAQKPDKGEITEESNEDFNKFLEQRESDIRGEMTGEFNSNSILSKNYFANIKSKKGGVIFDNSPMNSENSKFISKDLSQLDFNDNPSMGQNQIFISKIDNIGKVVLRFYIHGELYLSTIVSPGLIKKPTDENTYPTGHETDIYHISDTYPEKDPKKGIINAGGALMPYATFLANGIWIHGSEDKIDGKYHSHGCIRTPTYYAKEIFEKVNEIQNSGENVIIDTRGIY